MMTLAKVLYVQDSFDWDRLCFASVGNIRRFLYSIWVCSYTYISRSCTIESIIAISKCTEDTHLYFNDTSLLHHEAADLFEQFEGAFRQLYLHGHWGTLHARGRINGVAKQTVAGHLDADDSSNDRAAVNARSQLYAHKDAMTMWKQCFTMKDNFVYLYKFRNARDSVEIYSTIWQHTVERHRHSKR